MRGQISKKGRRRHSPALFVLLGMILFINLFSAMDYRVFSLLLNLKLQLGPAPQTRIILPPVGEIKANTHWLPVRIDVTLKSVDLSLLRQIVFTAPETVQNLQGELGSNLYRLLIYFLLKLVALAFAGAFFALWLAGFRQWKQYLWSGAAAFSTVLIIAATIYCSYDLNAFSQLEYEGIIEAAPLVINTVWEAIDRVQELGGRIQILARNLYSALHQLEIIEPLGLLEADLIALHVSDIHNNPVAYNFAKQVIESFPVDLVLDTGDLTDWGTALEAEISQRISGLGLPYLFTSGNHDSPEVLRRLAQIPNVLVIDGAEQNVAGLRIAGVGDLVADRFSPQPASLVELGAVAAQINEKWSKRERRPHIFMVHNQRIAKAIQPGIFPVVVFGHTHVLEIQEIGGTAYINAGTTGAAGIRGFQSKEPLPYSLALLYFTCNAENEPALTAVDGIHVTGLGLSFTLQRTFIGSGRIPIGDVETSH